MPIRVAKLMEILDAYDPDSFVKVYDATFKELLHIDNVFDKSYEDGLNVILSVKED